MSSGSRIVGYHSFGMRSLEGTVQGFCNFEFAGPPPGRSAPVSLQADGRGALNPHGCVPLRRSGFDLDRKEKPMKRKISRATVEILRGAGLTVDSLPPRAREAIEHQGPEETFPQHVTLEEILADNERRWRQ